jgi:hypothetical protein
VEPTATAPLDVDCIYSWQEEMRRAVARRDSLSAPACRAIALLLEQFLEEETAGGARAEEVRAAIALLSEASQPKRVFWAP